MAKPSAAEFFDIRDGIPTVEMARKVWALLIVHGKGKLPDADMPKEPRPWQRLMIKVMLLYIFASIQGARQGAGKTFIAAIVICCYLLLGGRVAVVLPSLKQGSRILLRRVARFMGVLAPLFGMRLVTKNEQEKCWKNADGSVEAWLFALSASDAGLKGTQGYTVDVIVIDESHEIAWENLGYFTPLVKIAMMAGRGKMIMIGVGGPENSMPEMAKNNAEWAPGCLIVNDEKIIEMDEEWRAGLAAANPQDFRLKQRSWKEEFAREEAISTPDKYDQFCRCKPVRVGQFRVFPYMRDTSGDLRGPARVVYDAGFKRRRWGGIDVATGEGRDSTVLSIIEKYGEVRNLTHVAVVPHGLNYPEQGRWIARWFKSHGVDTPEFHRRDIHIEMNGVGQDLYKAMDDPLDSEGGKFPGITPTSLDYPTKKFLVDEINDMMRPRGGMRPRFGIEDELVVTGIGSVAFHLAGLTANFDGRKWDYEKAHSDIFSSVLMAASACLMAATSA